jgi:molybdopterin-guanine dinucleotide biosynthesis protein A
MDTTLAILAGGRGNRMGGTKDQLRIGGRPALLHLLDQIGFAGPTMLVTSPAHPEPLGHERFERVVVDQLTNVGPLAGIIAALSAASTPLVCFLTVDMPNVGPEQVRWLVSGWHGHVRMALASPARREDHGHEYMTVPPLSALFCRRHHGTELVIEPFPSIVRASAAPAVADHLRAGHRSVRSLLQVPGFVAVDTPVDWPASAWLNLNEPRDLAGAGATFP